MFKGHNIVPLIIGVYLLGAACLFPLCIKGQSADRERIKVLDREIAAAFQSGSFDKALENAKEAITLINKEYGPESEEAAVAYSNIGRLELEFENYEDSINAFRRSIEIRERLNLTGSLDFIQLIAAQATAEERAKRYEDAGVSFLKALELIDERGSQDPKGVFAIALGAANGMARQGRFEEAEDLCVRSLRLAFEHFDVTSPERVNVLIYRNCLMGLSLNNQKKTRLQVEEERLKQNESETKGIRYGKARSLPSPAYPVRARERRESGIALVHIKLSKEGRVIEATTVCSSPILGGAALDAAKRSRFGPTYKNGEPVEVYGLLTYRFIGPL